MKKLDEQDHRTLVLWAADCAGHVLSIFEQTHPNDDRPRKALEAGRAWVEGLIPMSAARAAAFDSHAAARDSDSATARAAARAAGHAAATAHAASHARHAATYAVTAAGVSTERTWQLRRIPKHLRPIAFQPIGNGRIWKVAGES